jgi:hypothetical protein
MRRFLLLVAVALVMAAVMVATAGVAMASVATGNPCPSGLRTAHGSVPMEPQNETAHDNIPCG